MSRRLLSTLEILFIVFLACVPLFATFPYRVNIFLSWEGAYRISEGQLPFRDFGTPLGGMYWVIPGIFFKIFGAQMISLIKAQVFINIIAGLSFRSILKSLSVQEGIRFISVVVFCLSYSFMNFWPWYNHTVIVYELVALAFLFKYMTLTPVSRGRSALLLPAAAALFVVFSFFTKQDGGGMAFAICAALLAWNCFVEKKWLGLIVYLGSFVLIIGVLVLWLSNYQFGYWFNHGQAPHSARISVSEIADDFFNSSQWIKFYLLLIIVLLLSYFKTWKQLFENKNESIFLLLTLAMLAEAAVFQVTSYTPPDNNIFFHSFAFVYIVSLLVKSTSLNFFSRKVLIVCFAGTLLWWSGTYWKYIQRIIDRAVPPTEGATVSATGENIVNRKTFMIKKTDTLDIPMSEWVFTGLKSFDKIYMPKPTVDGIHRLMENPLVKNARGESGAGAVSASGQVAGGAAGSVGSVGGAGSVGAGGSAGAGGSGTSAGSAGAGGSGTSAGSPGSAGLKVLNMSELTPLAAEIPFSLERNEFYPLWFHLGVGMFNREAEMFEKRIAEKYYDLILFEHIETLNNFYPFRVRKAIQQHYKLTDSFMAPRRGDTQGLIEVYER